MSILLYIALALVLCVISVLFHDYYMSTYPTITQITPLKAECAICGQAKILRFRDTEMAGAGVCNDCVNSLCTADKILNNKHFTRPGKAV